MSLHKNVELSLLNHEVLRCPLTTEKEKVQETGLSMLLSLRHAAYLKLFAATVAFTGSSISVSLYLFFNRLHLLIQMRF